MISSKSDSASMKLYDAVMRLEGWSKPISLDIGDYYMHDCGRVYLLLIEEIHVKADHIDTLFEEKTSLMVEEVLILSRHVSNSNTPAMTLHAIGIPGILPYGEDGKAGGKNGILVPPGKYFASLFRRMNELARGKNLDSDFDLTLESTHHGPVLTSPTLYIEIGSTENEWSRDDVADCWAEIISDVLGMFDIGTSNFDPKSDVMIGFGGLQVVNISFALILTTWKMVSISMYLSVMVLLPILLGTLLVQAMIRSWFGLMKRNQEQLALNRFHVEH